MMFHNVGLNFIFLGKVSSIPIVGHESKDINRNFYSSS
jgi:hypothetical protein